MISMSETKHVELEQFLHAFASRGFVSVSWAFLLINITICLCCVVYVGLWYVCTMQYDTIR